MPFLFAPFFSTSWRQRDILSFSELCVDFNYYGFGAPLTQHLERPGPFAQLPWLIPAAHFGDAYIAVATVTFDTLSGKVTQMMFPPFQQSPWRKPDQQFGAAYQSVLIGPGTSTWVRYNAFGQYWEYSIDNTNFFRLPENPYIPTNLYFKNIGNDRPAVPDLGEGKMYIRNISGSPKLCVLWNNAQEDVLSAGPGTTVLPGATSFWRLDEPTGSQRNDALGTNHLSDNGGAVRVVGKLGNAAAFGGIQYLSIVNNPSVSVAGISFEFFGWLQLANLAATYGVLGKWTAGDVSYALIFNSATNRLEWFVSADGTTVGVAVGAATFGVPPVNTWIFFDVYYDILGQVGISINGGAFDVAAAPVGGIWGGATPFSLGSFNSANFLVGRLDAVGFYRRLLSAGERATFVLGYEP